MIYVCERGARNRLWLLEGGSRTMGKSAFTRKKRVARCPNCGLDEVVSRTTRSVPGKHYHCDNCGHEWQDRVVRRYRQRTILYHWLLKAILGRRDQLDSQDRLFVEKLLEKGNYSLKIHARLLRIAHKAGIDPRESE